MGRFLIVVGAVVLLSLGCGGGGEGNDGGDLAMLQGSWFGPTVGGSLRLVFDGAGGITQVLDDGTDQGLTGSVQHVSGTYYEGQLSNGRLVRLVLDPAGSHAAFFGEFRIASLQRGATALPPGGFQVADIAPADYTGVNLVIDAQVRVTDTYPTSVSIAGDGSYLGTDASGLSFGSPGATGLAPAAGVLQGPYENNAVPSIGLLEILPSPDLLFLVAVAFPETNSTLLNGQFIGAWNRD